MDRSHEIQLKRHEVTSVASTSPRCMVVYPLGKKSRQRIGLGDKTGAVSVFSIDKSMGRVPVFDTTPQGKPVSCATLYEDQLFFVRGSVLEAYSRKGKLFFTFDTNVTEVIHTVFVCTPFIITSGSFMVTGFQEAKELGFYMAPDRINAMVAFVTNPTKKREDRSFDDYRCALGCNDRTIRVLCNHQAALEIHCEATLSALCVSDAPCKVYYGTTAGSLGCLDLKRSDSTLMREFSYIPDGHQAAVTALAAYDINMDGKEELLVGRQDGSLQVFSIHSEEGATTSHPICIWSGKTDESVLSIACGLITHPNRPDMLVHAFSGRITAFTLKEEENNASSMKIGAADADGVKNENPTDAQITEVRREIEHLKKAIVVKTQELADSTGATHVGKPVLAVSSTFTTKVTLLHQQNTPALQLVVETDTPMDCVALQSEVRLHFVKALSAEVAVREDIPMHNPHTKTLAVVRLAEARRYSCSVAFWVEEGHWGTLKVTALAAPAPRTAQVKAVQLRPLQLFARVAGNNEKKDNTPQSSSMLEVRGDFSARDMHSWIFMLLPGTPELYQPKLSTLRYEDAFLHSTLEIEYSDGTATFFTESLPALTVARRFISNCAAERSLGVSFRVAVHADAVQCNLRLIVPRIAACNTASNNTHLLEALRELQGSQETEMTFLPKEHRMLLDGADQVAKEHIQATLMTAYLQKSLVALYDSVSDFLPHIPKMTSTTKENLAAASSHGDAAALMAELERVFCC